MGNLSNIPNPVVEKVYDWWKKQGISEAPRRYLGASIVGHECDMYLWLYFRGLIREDFDGRMYRLFDRGRREEETFVRELRGIGCEVWDVDPRTGRQWAVSALGGHFGGHLDGVARGIPGAEKTPHVLEFKTHSSASFSKLEKSGVKTAKPMHYTQMQVYMGLMTLTRALYVAVNKDTDALYTERIDFDKDFFRATMERARRIITDPAAEKCASRPDDYRCRFCAGREICWPTDDRLSVVPKNACVDCRTCCYASASKTDAGAVWRCANTADPGSGVCCQFGTDTSCQSHLLLPTLVRSEAYWTTSEQPGCMQHRLPDGTVIANGPSAISSVELRDQPAKVLLSPEVETFRNVFPGAHVVDSSSPNKK